MKVRLLLFAQYRDAAGASELVLELPEGSRALDAVALLRGSRGVDQRIPAEPVVAVNQEYASIDTLLHDGDELALLPPVAGG